MNNRPIL